MRIRGNVWKFGDDLGAMDLLSARYDREGMSGNWSECAKHVLEDVEPNFPSTVQKGDILVAGYNLGAGHAHYHRAAVMACATAGLTGMFARSVNALFLRVAVDLGVPVWSFSDLADFVSSGDKLEIDLRAGVATNLTSGDRLKVTPLPDIILDILDAGSSESWAYRRVAAR
jgi:3-isopropylmalate/(R)-2-methylmalate dehydratase small subunit